MSHLLFLSHAGVDTEAALRLAERIETSCEAQRAGLRVFIDKPDLRAGSRWKDQLQQALQASTAFAVYVGSKGVVNWVWDEVSVALDRAHADPAYPLIPVLSASANRKDLPSFLSQFQGVSDVENQPEQFEHFLRGILRLGARAQVASEREPFVGLEAFDSRKAHLFFGREPETAELVELLRHESLVMVVGDSGSGKSSLVKAGLVPAFRGGRLGPSRDQGSDDTLWYVVETRPGNDPFGRLADDLRKAAEAARKGPRAASEIAELVREKKPSKVRDALFTSAPSELGLETKVLLVVDQFEELRASPDAMAYADMLAALAPDGEDTVRIVLTMRRDYYYLCSSFPALYERLEGHDRRARYHLRRIGKERLRSCVAEPLRLAGVDAPMRTMLADAVTRDTGDEPGELALLQMALWRAWARRNEHGGDLLKSYQAIGRVDGAIAQHAEEVFKGLTSEEQERAEGLFLRSVRPGEAGGVTRRTAQLDEFDPPTQELAKKLGEKEYRLLRLGESTVEITHEALATQWHLYQQWVSNAPGDPRGDDLRTLQSLTADAAGWVQAEGKRKGEHLARGHDLSLYDSLASRRPSWITRERAYIDASRQAAWWSVAWRRSALAALVILTAIALGFAYYALDQGYKAVAFAESANEQRELADKRAGEAQEQRNLAQEREREAARQTLIAQERERDAERQTLEAQKQRKEAQDQRNRALLTQSRFLSEQANQHIRTGDAGTAMLLTLEALPHALNDLERPYAPEAEAVLLNAYQHLQEQHLLMGHTDQMPSAVFSPDGQRVLTASTDSTARVWDAQTGQQVAVLEGHTSSVLGAAFSPDGQRALTASGDKTTRIWEAQTGKQITILQGHTDAVLSAIFSPDGQSVLTASTDSTARIWDAQTGQQVAVLESHTSSVLGAVFSPDGQRVLTASADGTARIWDVQTRQQVAVLWGHTGSLQSAVFSLDGQRVLTASGDRTARIWNAQTGQQIALLQGHTGGLSSAVFSPDGQRVLTASGDSTARIWDAQTGQQIALLQGHTSWVPSAVFSPDGRRVLTASWDRTARIWDAQTGKEATILRGHTSTVRSAVFSPDGQRVLTASGDNTARIWNAQTDEQIAILKGHTDIVQSAVFSPDGQRVLTASDDKTARVWDAQTGKEATILRGHTSTVRSAVFSPDGQRVLTASGNFLRDSNDSTARIWNAQTDEQVAILKGHTDIVQSAVFSPDGQRVLTASDDKTARVWDAQTGRETTVLRGHVDWVASAVFSLDGQRVLTASGDSTARIWNAQTGQQVAVLQGHRSRVRSAVFSLDGQRVLTASGDRTARIWNAQTGQQIALLQGHTGGLSSAVFSPDGQRVLTASGDSTARIWDAQTGQQIALLQGHTSEVRSAVFSLDGQRVLTASNDRTARVWDRQTGQQVAILQGHTGGLSSAVFSPDGQRVLTASSDRTARIWRVFPTTQALADEAKHRVARCLTREQRIQAFLEPEPLAWCIELEKWPYATSGWKAWLKFKRENANPPLPDTPEWASWMTARVPR